MDRNHEGEMVMKPKTSESKLELREAQADLAAWWRKHKEGAQGTPVRSEVVKHLEALRKCIERTKTIDDQSAESGSSWKSPELEGDIESAERALAFICELFGVSSEDK